MLDERRERTGGPERKGGPKLAMGCIRKPALLLGQPVGSLVWDE
jgi:hypothetical protein